MAPSQGLGYLCLHQRAKPNNRRKITCVSRPLSLKRLRSTIRNPLTGERGFQNPGVCLKEFLSFLSPPRLSFFGSRSISCAAKTENPFLGLSLLRNMTETLASHLNLAFPLPVLGPRPLCINRILSCTEASWYNWDKDSKSASLWLSG